MEIEESNLDSRKDESKSRDIKKNQSKSIKKN
jgi:hypothetical protein